MVLLRTAGIDAFGGKSVLAQFACARVRFGLWLWVEYGGCIIERIIEYGLRHSDLALLAEDPQ